MLNRKDHSTLEPVQNQDNQPGLEFDPTNSPPKYEDNSIGDAAVKENEQWILGVRRKTFIIVATVVTLFMIAIIGGVVGGVMSKKRVSPSPISTAPLPPSSPLPATNILQNSSLASVNWTSVGLQYYGVFYQNKNNSIVMSLWDPKTTTWTPSPIYSDNRFGALPGTHITAAAWAPRNTTNTTQVNVYITSKNDALLEFWTQDPYAGDQWSIGDLSNNPSKPKSLHGSKLAVHYSGCSEPICKNSPVLLYQTTAQVLRYGNISDGAWNINDVANDPFESDAPMALMSLAPGGNDLGLNITKKLKAYVGKAGNIVEYTWGSSNSGWTNDGLFFKNQLPPKAPLEIASTTLKKTSTSDWPDLLVLGLYLEGDVRVLKAMVGTGNGDDWTAAVPPKMTNSMSNITAMATNFDRRVYGFSEGNIYEHEITKDSLSWDFKGFVRT